VKSGIADLKNYPSGRVGSVQGGGAIMAALFLREFIANPDKLQWAHIDAAGDSPPQYTVFLE
jgi:leucyl aminopeptidase